MAFYTEKIKFFLVIIMANDRQPVISYSHVTVATALSVFIIEMLMM